jgi:shikimate kinase
VPVSPSSLRIALVGYRGAGKSTVGSALAALLGAPFVDVDRELAREGEGAGELLARVGEPEFRALELAATRRVLARPAPLVIATGGGVVETAAARALLREHAFCVWLRAPAAVLARRIARDPAFRPALTSAADGASEVELVRARRAPLYAEVARAEVASDAGDAATVARAILRALPATPDSPGDP